MITTADPTLATIEAAFPPGYRIVALGGGTGLPIVLRGLKAALFPPGWPWAPARDRDRLAAIVTVADDGGSSGRLRRAYRVRPPGDIRNCLLALSNGDPTMTAVFGFRFSGDGELGGHSLGNLILAALSNLERDFAEAVERGGQMLDIQGRVFPSTLQDVALRAEFADGTWVEGESRIAAARRPVRAVCLQPADPPALPQAVAAIAAADVVVIGPGSLYTSLIPNLLVREIAGALAETRARVVLVANLMTEPGETDGYSVADHVSAIRRHAAQVPIHDVLLNTSPIPGAFVSRYGARGAHPVRMDGTAVKALGARPIERDLLGDGDKIRHDPQKLARTILDLGMEVPE
jgi:uncharacterized cofD-like protein